MKVPIGRDTGFVLEADDTGLVSVYYEGQRADEAVITLLVKEQHIGVRMHDTTDRGHDLEGTTGYSLDESDGKGAMRWSEA